MATKITKRPIEPHDYDLQCDFCGYPMDLEEEPYGRDGAHYFEIENMEFLGFCSRSCAREFVEHHAELEEG